MLTTGVDNVAGTSGNDTIVASTVYDSSEVVTSASTYSVADAIAGGSGTDVMNLVISGAHDAAVVIPSGSVTGVETLNVRNTVAQTASLNASTIAGLTAFNADRSVGALTVTDLANGASAGMIGDGTATNGAFNVGYAAAATAATLNVSGGTTGGAVALTGAGLLSTTINSTGAANTIGAFTDAATSKALTINATTGLTTGTIGDSLARTSITINATGDVTTGAVTSTAATTVAISGAGDVMSLFAVKAPGFFGVKAPPGKAEIGSRTGIKNGWIFLVLQLGI